VHAGRVVFGCHDGRLHCLRAADGAPLWRCSVAPANAPAATAPPPAVFAAPCLIPPTRRPGPLPEDSDGVQEGGGCDYTASGGGGGGGGGGGWAEALVCAGASDGHVAVVRAGSGPAAGRPVWRWRLPGAVFSAPAAVRLPRGPHPNSGCRAAGSDSETTAAVSKSERAQALGRGAGLGGDSDVGPGGSRRSGGAELEVAEAEKAGGAVGGERPGRLVVVVGCRDDYLYCLQSE
jgi:hypothetical protein